MSVSQVFSFPDTVDEHAARLVASGVVVMSLAIVLGGQRWVLIPLAAGFVARVASGPRFSPLALAVTRVIVPRLPWSPKMTSGAPKRFAQGIGATLSAAARLAEYIVQSPGAATALVSAIAVAASLEAGLGFCLGCKIFAVLMRAGLVSEEVCEACNDLSKRPIAA